MFQVYFFYVIAIHLYIKLVKNYLRQFYLNLSDKINLNTIDSCYKNGTKVKVVSRKNKC